MFRTFLEKLKLTNSKTTTQTSVVPDISRILKIPKTMADTKSAMPQTETLDTEMLGSRAEAAIDDLSGQFETWMQMDMDRLTEAWLKAQEQNAGQSEYRELHTCAHNIRGVAGSYGYPAISRLCGSLCTLLSESRPGENMALINLHVEACRAAHTSIGRGDSAQSVANAVCDALEERVALKTAAG